MHRSPAALAALLLLLVVGPGQPALARPVPDHASGVGPAVPALPGATVVPAAWSSAVAVIHGRFYGISEVVDSTNHLHIAATGISGGKEGLWYLTDRTGHWTAKRILADSTDDSWTSPSIALDEHDRVHVAATWYNELTPGGPLGIYYVTDQGRARGTFPSHATFLADGDLPSLKVAGGHVFLAYVGPDRACPGEEGIPVCRIRFKTDAGGAWTDVKVPGLGYGPTLRLTSGLRARIAFVRWTANGTQSGIGYAAAGSATGSFTVTTIPGTNGHDDGPLLALDSGGRPEVAWSHEGAPRASVRFARRNAAGWTSVVSLFSVGNRPALGFDLDTLGRPHVVAANLEDETIREKRLVNGTWVASIVAGHVEAWAIALRRAFSGRVAVTWASDSAVYVSKG